MFSLRRNPDSIYRPFRQMTRYGGVIVTKRWILAWGGTFVWCWRDFARFNESFPAR